jgi:hypothetical protein
VLLAPEPAERWPSFMGAGTVQVGLGHIAALPHRSSTLYQIR